MSAVTVACPKCGSTAIAQIDRVEVKNGVAYWTLDDKGVPQPGDYTGDSTTLWDTAEHYCYWCDGCDTELEESALVAVPLAARAEGDKA